MRRKPALSVNQRIPKEVKMSTTTTSVSRNRSVAQHAPAPTRPNSDRDTMGAVYTPEVLAQWVASLLDDHRNDPPRRVLDPACGDGALLAAACQALPEVELLVGVDLSASATDAVNSAWPARASVVTADALRLQPTDLPHVDAVIMNPPWGADLDISRDELRALGYELANGQYDSWDLFVEWTIRTFGAGTRIAAILPDAILQPEHRGARKLLLERTQLHVVARLGEGWFEGVYRGVAVIVYTVGRPNGGQIRCIRLPHDARHRVISGKSDLSIEVRDVETSISQDVWASDPNSTFMPAATERSVEQLRVIEAQRGAWLDWVAPGRGVEIGKSGALVRCGVCGLHRQPPRDGIATCANCRNSTLWNHVSATSFTNPGDSAHWAPLIVGEDVRRFQASPSRWLRLGMPGVQYKDESVYRSAKLLVRKTGLGLNASLDVSGSYTNQVVYHYTARPGAPAFVLSYLEGVMCSRVLLAVHLSRTGETEWRSHPYVTPKVLATLPIPSPVSGTAAWATAVAIAQASDAVRSASVGDRAVAEVSIDRLVAELFGLNADGMRWVDSVLARTQNLQAFSHLRPGAGPAWSESAA